MNVIDLLENNIETEKSNKEDVINVSLPDENRVGMLGKNRRFKIVHKNNYQLR